MTLYGRLVVERAAFDYCKQCVGRGKGSLSIAPY